MNNKKRCNKCNEEKELSEFYQRNKCKKCTKEYVLAWARQNKEKRNSYRKHYLIKCIVCEKEHLARISNAKYCSPTCQSKHSWILGKIKAQHKGKSKEIACLKCGKLIKSFDCENRKYCSKECHDKSAVRLNRKCLSCGKEFVFLLSKTKTNASGNYCSRHCYEISLHGSGCKFWKGGITIPVYGQEFTNKLKREIRRKSNNKCQMCNKESQRALSIHHIDQNKFNNNKDNLTPLCSSCHTYVHGNRNKKPEVKYESQRLNACQI